MPEIRFTDDELRSIQQEQQEAVDTFEVTFGRFREWLKETSYRLLAKWEWHLGAQRSGQNSV